MASPAKGFVERYRSLVDGELLELALAPQDLTPEAKAALDAELAARGFAEEAITEFRERLQAPAESDTSSFPEEVPAITELQDDHYDERPAAPSLASCRPKGVTVCAFIFWLSGVTGVFSGVMSIANREPAGIGVLIIGLLIFISGCGLWRLKSWARKLGVILCWATASMTCLALMNVAVLALRGIETAPFLVFSWIFMSAWQVLWALYLGSDTARAAFIANRSIAQHTLRR